MLIKTLQLWTYTSPFSLNTRQTNDDLYALMTEYDF